MQDDDIKILIRRLPQLTTDQTVGLLLAEPTQSCQYAIS